MLRSWAWHGARRRRVYSWDRIGEIFFRIIQIFFCLCSGGRRGPGGTMLRATPSRPSSARTARTCSPGGWGQPELRQTDSNPINVMKLAYGITLILISGPDSISPSCLGEDHNHKVVIAMNKCPQKPSIKLLLHHRKTTSILLLVSAANH